jgi:hypothetical protein
VIRAEESRLWSGGFDKTGRFDKHMLEAITVADDPEE